MLKIETEGYHHLLSHRIPFLNHLETQYYDLFYSSQEVLTIHYVK